VLQSTSMSTLALGPLTGLLMTLPMQMRPRSDCTFGTLLGVSHSTLHLVDPVKADLCFQWVTSRKYWA
jgi:hypothetical protein